MGSGSVEAVIGIKPGIFPIPTHTYFLLLIVFSGKVKCCNCTNATEREHVQELQFDVSG